MPWYKIQCGLIREVTKEIWKHPSKIPSHREESFKDSLTGCKAVIKTSFICNQSLSQYIMEKGVFPGNLLHPCQWRAYSSFGIMCVCLSVYMCTPWVCTNFTASFTHGINNYPSELRFSMLAHIIKITICYGRAELGLSIKDIYLQAQISQC